MNQRVPDSGIRSTKVLAIVGPTAVGKSKVALELAKRLDGEIISADSMQVYQGMDIGTAKPSPLERKEVRHHLLDLIPPSKNFSVAEYQELAREAIFKIQSRGKLPILVGGSGLYIRAVIDRLKFPSGILRSPTRLELEKRAQAEGGEVLYRELKRLDPEAAKKIHPQNLRRIVRALEVITLTGEPFSEFQREWGKRVSDYHLFMVGLKMPREKLYAQIDERTDKQLEAGLLREVEVLLSQGYGGTITAKQALAYKELSDYLEGKSFFDETVELIKRRTRHFARRQLTWFRRDPRIKWVDVSNKTPSEVADEVIDFLQRKKFAQSARVD